MGPLTPQALKAMLEILSPVRPKRVQVGSGLGSLAAGLKGGPQPAGQLLNQLRGKPGVKPGALTEHLGHVDPAQKMTPLELGAAVRSPKLFAQRGITDKLDDDGAQELANDLIFSAPFEERRHNIIRSMLRDAEMYTEDRGLVNQAETLLDTFGDGRPSAQALGDAQNFIERKLGQSLSDVYMDELAEDAFSMASTQQMGKRMTPAYANYQRQPGLATGMPRHREYPEDRAEYFETVLRGTPSRAKRDLNIAGQSDHFMNPSQLGHARGSVTPSGNVYVEELQSDALEGAPDHPALTDIYGKLGRMLIDRSAEARAPSVSFPDANRIGSVRDSKNMPFFRDVYDKQLKKQLYDPLAKRGVPLRTDNGWTTMDLPEGILRAISKGLLDYKRGGLVR